MFLVERIVEHQNLNMIWGLLWKDRIPQLGFNIKTQHNGW